MKVCYIADASSPHSLIWISYFAAKGHKICWISASGLDGDLPPNTEFHQIKNAGSKSAKIIFNIAAVRHLVKKAKPDILHSHYAGVNGVLGWLSGFHPSVLTAWGSDILFAGKSFFARPLIGAALKDANLITCDAFHLKNEIIKFGIPEDKIKIINFGVETDIFLPANADKKLRERLGISGCPSVISLRSLEPVYDIPTLISAASIVAKKIRNVKFVIGGRGSSEGALKKMASDLGISRNVIFAGFIRRNDLPRWLNSFDLYVSTSLSDAGIASCTAEAMSCGKPVVISNSAENDKWISNGKNGFLFPARDAQKLAEMLIRLLSEAPDRKIGLAGRQTIIEKKDYNNEMSKMEDLYEKLLAGYGKQ